MQLKSTQLEIPEDSSVAGWIEPELTGDVSSVTGTIPDCFEVYARIFHPAWTRDGQLARWSEVAAVLGREMHALAQWHALVGSADPDDLSDSEWDGSEPERGDLALDILVPLSALLERHTGSAGHCFFGLWTGWASVVFQVFSSGGSVRDEVEQVSSIADIPGPRFGLPPQSGRDYLLLSGPLAAAVEIAEADLSGGLGPTSPNLIWPADRSWFLASDIDFDSTLVGGSDALIESIVDSNEIEAWRVEPSDSLSADADDRN